MNRAKKMAPLVNLLNSNIAPDRAIAESIGGIFEELWMDIDHLESSLVGFVSQSGPEGDLGRSLIVEMDSILNRIAHAHLSELEPLHDYVGQLRNATVSYLEP